MVLPLGLFGSFLAFFFLVSFLGAFFFLLVAFLSMDFCARRRAGIVRPIQVATQARRSVPRLAGGQAARCCARGREAHLRRHG